MATRLTEGTPWRVIGAFTIPLVLGNLIQQAYQIADTAVVGRFLGVLPLAAVGSTGSIIWLITGFSWGMTAGLTVPVAQGYGARDDHAVRRSVAAGTVICAGLALVLTLIGTLFIGPLLRLMQTPEAIIDDARTYAFISFAFTVAAVAFNYLSAIIRAVGDSRTPVVFLALASVLNISLDVVLIAVLGMGVEGAAWATVLAQSVSVALCLWWIRRRFPVFHLDRDDWRTTWPEVRHHLALGLPLGFQSSIIAIGAVAIQVRLNSLGPDAVAAFTTAARVDGLAGGLLIALGMAVSMYVAQNFGARAFDRVRTGVTQGVALSVVVSVVMGGVLALLSRPIARLFIGDGSDTVIEMAADAVSVYALCYSVLGVLFVVRGALQGLGRMKAPFNSGLAELVVRVGAAIWLGELMGFMGVAWGQPAAWLSAVLLLGPAYVRAHRQLRDPEAYLAAYVDRVPGARGTLPRARLGRPRIPGVGPRPRRLSNDPGARARRRAPGPRVGAASSAPDPDGPGPQQDAGTPDRPGTEG